MSIGEEILQRIKESGLPVIIYGCGTVGQLLLDFFRKEGVEVAFFCDDNEEYAERNVSGVDVCYSKTAVDKYKDYYYVISFINVFQTINFLKDNSIGNYCAGGSLIASYDFEKEYSEKEHYELTRNEYLTRMTVLGHEYYESFHSEANKKKISVQSLSLPLSTHCTLKCRDCSALLPFYKHKENYDVERIIENLDRALKYIDEIYYLTLTGGEPLLNKDWYKIVEYVTGLDKVKQIYIFSTGMAPVDQEKIHLLSAPNLHVHLSDYGELSKGMREFAELLKINKVKHFIHKDLVWYAPYTLSKKNRTPQENVEVLKNCSSYGCYYLIYDKLFKCSFASTIYRMNMIDQKKDDSFINFAEIDGRDDSFEDKFKEIWDFVNIRKPFSCCDYCDSFINPQDRKLVTPAVQLD